MVDHGRPMVDHDRSWSTMAEHSQGVVVCGRKPMFGCEAIIDASHAEAYIRIALCNMYIYVYIYCLELYTQNKTTQRTEATDIYHPVSSNQYTLG